MNAPRSIPVTGMILAAGRGERMRPWTDTMPKPLVEVRGKPLIVHHIDKFVAMGITQIVINVSYLAEKIQTALGDGSRFGCTIAYSFEPERLETGGGLATASALFGSALFLWASADIYCDIDYQQITPILPIYKGEGLRSWQSDFDAHCLMVPRVDGEPGGEFAIDGDGRLHEGAPRHTLANIGVIKTAITQNWPRNERFTLMSRYRELLVAGRMSGELFTGRWCNVTTMADVARLNAG
jgi:N-acetyl-alpha-D-muramate 1-phosphate uridylyltransferase